MAIVDISLSTNALGPFTCAAQSGDVFSIPAGRFFIQAFGAEHIFHSSALPAAHA